MISMALDPEAEAGVTPRGMEIFLPKGHWRYGNKS